MLGSVYVLVHPAWFGGWCWQRVAGSLRAAGRIVHAPTLTGLGERAHLATPDVGLSVHVEDVVNMIVFEDLYDVVLVGSSSSGAVVAGVADRVPERLRRAVYLDAFVPADGESIVDLIPDERREGMEALVESEGDGWLLPRFAATPWDRFVPEAWHVTEEADLRWLLPRLRPTPFRHFTEPLRLERAPDEGPRRAYVRCLGWPHPGFDRHAAHAADSPAWDLHELEASHLPYVTSPAETTALLVALAA
ncbi:MAG TPA: alpha/beta fold hydrolase [Gaiella sp.]|jgi:pimeloyl-ACP methyl ester carboxylesterase|nr:alpha/beta fold hydrolase [Gaiella sp.]